MTLLPRRLVVPYCRPPAEPPPVLVLAKHPESTHAARKYAREFVNYHVPGIPAGLRDDAVLIVSELVTNALRYGTEPGDFLRLVLDADPGRIRIEVHDPSRRRPHPKAESDERQRGRGLFIIEALAAGWGVEDRPMGKAVWVELRWGQE
ncbi:ATP-binding protein [Streptomyces sp. NPDC006512]|uniref:ATP-binding protein n=1 Tax=Streptomyces sp. NPDC006512 TaxID=3154307 RepID=UPI0033AFA607